MKDKVLIGLIAAAAVVILGFITVTALVETGVLQPRSSKSSADQVALPIGTVQIPTSKDGRWALPPRDVFPSNSPLRTGSQFGLASAIDIKGQAPYTSMDLGPIVMDVLGEYIVNYDSLPNNGQSLKTGSVCVDSAFVVFGAGTHPSQDVVDQKAAECNPQAVVVLQFFKPIPPAQRRVAVSPPNGDLRPTPITTPISDPNG